MLPLQRCAHSTVGRGPRARCSRLQKQRLRRAEAGRPGSSLPPGSTRAAGPAVHSQLPHTASTTARERGAEPAQRVPSPGPSPGPLGLSCGAGAGWRAAARSKHKATGCKVALRWQKLCSSALLVPLRCTMGVRTPQAAALCSLSVLNYLDGSRKARPSWCLCLQHRAALAEAWQSQHGAACSSSLLLAARQSSVFPQPSKGGSVVNVGTGGLFPVWGGTTGLLEQSRDFASSARSREPPSMGSALREPPQAGAKHRRSRVLEREPYLFHGHRIALVIDSTHTGDRQQHGPAGSGRRGRIHTEICFFRGAGRRDGAPQPGSRSCCGAAPAPIKDRNIK